MKNHKSIYKLKVENLQIKRDISLLQKKNSEQGVQIIQERNETKMLRIENQEMTLKLAAAEDLRKNNEIWNEELKRKVSEGNKTLAANKKEIKDYVNKISNLIKEGDEVENEIRKRDEENKELRSTNLALEMQLKDKEEMSGINKPKSTNRALEMEIKEIKERKTGEMISENNIYRSEEVYEENRDDEDDEKYIKVCRFFHNGNKCRKGTECDFKHKRICKFYIEGRCDKEGCDFVHTKRNLCRQNISKKQCRYGEKCKFIHVYKSNSQKSKYNENMTPRKSNSDYTNGMEKKVIGKQIGDEPSAAVNNNGYIDKQRKNETRVYFLEKEIQEIKNLLQRFNPSQQTMLEPLPNQGYYQTMGENPNQYPIYHYRHGHN